MIDSAMLFQERLLPVRRSGLSVENTVAMGDVHVSIGEQGKIELSEASLCPFNIAPSEVREVGIGGAGDNLTALLTELF